MQSRLATLSTLALLAGFAGNAYAQVQPTAAQAAALESQITDWLKTVTAGAVPLPTRPVQLTAEGDHYLVRVPLGEFGRVQPADAAFTAKARMLDATRWALDDQRFPDDMTFAGTEMAPDEPDAKNPSPSGMHAEAVTYHAKLGQQDVHGVFDPSYTQPATTGGTIASVDIEKTGGTAASTSHMGRVTYQSSTRPIDPAHIDLVQDGMVEGYATHTELPGGDAFDLEAKSLHIVTALSGVAHDKVVPLIHAAIELGRLVKAPGGDAPEPTQAERAQLHAMLQAAREMLTGGKLDESAEGLKFDLAGTSGSVGKLDISFGGDAPQSTLSAQMGLTLDGLVIDMLPPAFAAYVPSHIAIRPTVSNIDVAALTTMGMDATAPAPAGQSQAMAAPDPAVLFAHGGINFGFDALEVAVADTKLTGTGKFNLPRPNAVTGQMDITATGLDALITKLQADPMMAQGVPVVIFLKGIARSTGSQAVWQVTVDNAKILVNGVDLSAMAGAMGK